MAKPKKINGKKKVVKSSSSSELNVNASLLRLEKRYEELQKAAAKTLASEDEDGAVTSDYVVATRALGYIDDWVPIAQICIVREDESDNVPVLPAVISQYCRELSKVAATGSTLFQSIPRHLFEYSVETEASFHKFVFDPIVQGNLEQVEGQVMTKAMAKEILELEDLSEVNDRERKSKIKSAYRKKSFEFHPDRFVGKDLSPDETTTAANAYSSIQRAYETLSSGVVGSSSWYASLGGRARTDFIGPVELLPLGVASEIAIGAESALLGLDPAIVQQFVARSQQVSSSRK